MKAVDTALLQAIAELARRKGLSPTAAIDWMRNTLAQMSAPRDSYLSWENARCAVWSRTL